MVPLQADSSQSALASFWASLPSLLWCVLAATLLLLLHRDVRAVLQALLWKIRTGSAIKLAAFEIGQSYVSPTAGVTKGGALTEIGKDSNGRRWDQREQYYKPNRQLMLVHRLAPSSKHGQLYDVLIYVLPHHSSDATLACVKHVDYYFGRHWGNAIFRSNDRAHGFAVATSAYGAFMSTAEVTFTDGQVVEIARYVDFEMGPVGAVQTTTS